jgi:DNA-directed RNA polymerase subunit beta'
MAHLDPREAYEYYRDRVLEGIGAHFPIRGRNQELRLEGLEVKDTLHPDDVTSQHEAKMSGSSWSVPVFANLKLVDNATGKTVDARRIRVAEIPKATRRYSYIVDGQEYQVDNQWQLKPGVYTRRRQNGELESRFNVTGKTAFDIVFDPSSKRFLMEYGKSNRPLYPFLKVMGVDDDTLERSWGKEIFFANRDARGAAGTIEGFYKSDRKQVAPSREAAEEHVQSVFAQSRLRPEATQVTLGHPFDHVTGEALHLATKKILQVQAGHPEDDRDSLIFKDLRTAGDFAHDQLTNPQAVRTTHLKVLRQLNRATGTPDIRDLLRFDLLNEPIKYSFHKNPAARVADQINPVEMVAASQQTTIMGPGGIQSEQSIMNEAKLINPSHLGFLDPVHTPEGSRSGITLRLPLGVKKVGREARIPVYNKETSKIEFIGPSEFMATDVVLPDQVKWEDGKPIPLSHSVKLVAGGNEIREGKFKDAKYVMRNSSQLFNVATNLIPFLGTVSGNRASYASHHIEQAISLAHREPPLVQVATGVSSPELHTFEALIGRQSSHQTPVAGTVHDVKDRAIVIEGEDGKKHSVAVYRNFPLNDAKGVLDSTPLVKPGDKVKAGQTIADTNFSRNGVLALGNNLKTAYIPYRGYNFEDAIVISESAAKKLTSVHMHKHELKKDETLVTSPRKFIVQHPGVFKKEQYEKLDDDGVVRVGQRVGPGDPLVVAMRPYILKDRTGVNAIRRSISGAHTDQSLRWDNDIEGEVVGVHKGREGISVHVKTIEPAQVADKLAGRYGNKGVIGKILPDKDMPHTKDGPIEILLNPTGIAGRMNLGQVLETAASKIALKTGKTYVVKNFEPHTDQLAKVKGELKAHGLSDTEEVFDPLTGQTLGKALVGHQHILKLVHQVDKKVSVRSGMGLPGLGNQEHYDQNLQPTGGSGVGGQRMDPLGLYGLLSHGSKALIREMHTWKSEGPDPQSNPAKAWASQHNQVWTAIQTGSPLPTPRSTFAFDKFQHLLKGAGINIEKKGHDFVLSPLTDKHILEMSAGALPKPSDLLLSRFSKEGEPKPKPGGLFDERLTGGHGGKKWTHIVLAEPVPNPVFEKPILSLTGLSQKDFHAVVSGEKSVNTTGHLVDVGAGTTGGAGIKILLDKIDVTKELTSTRKELTAAPSAKVDKLVRKVKYLQALDQLKMKPSDAYILHHVPVLPPAMRPVSVLPDGNLHYADLNGLYSEFAQVNEQLKNPVRQQYTNDEQNRELRKDLYDGVQAIVGLGVPYGDAKHKGILHQLRGASPKVGYFQRTLMNRRQDMTMRSTIVPEPALGLDEVGLPREKALSLFSPFVVHQLVQAGGAPTPLDAQKRVAAALNGKHDPIVWSALDKVTEDRPVLLKRDPALHKYSVQAFRARPVAGSAIQIHPLTTSGFNADHDGDTMSVFVPIHPDAVAEARKMMPSNNLFYESSGRVAYAPTLESALGLYKLSLVGKHSSQKFAHPGEALEAVRHGKIAIDDLVHVGSSKTTPGRILLASALPEPMQKKVLSDHDMRLDRAGLDKLLSQLGKDHSKDYALSVNTLKDLGNGASYGAIPVPQPSTMGPGTIDPKNKVYIPVPTHTLSLDDFEPDRKTREYVLGEAQKKVDQIYAGKLPRVEQDRRAVAVWSESSKVMREMHEKKMEKNPSNLFLMHRAGIKPSWDQYKQMALAPMVLMDASNKPVPTPVMRSYAEGLDVGGYWTQMHGARRGTIMKVQEVRDPGYMNKLLINNMMHMLVSAHDCGTDRGIVLPVTEKDIHDRFLVQDFKAGHLHVPAGTLLTSDIVSQIRAADRGARLMVRSPLKCEDEKGFCQKCVGPSVSGQLHPLGTNIGVMSAQALGERATQLSLKAFHSGGAEQGGSKLLNAFGRFEQLAKLPQKIPDAATLAMVAGKVEKIEKDPTGVKVWIGSKMHHIGRDANGMALHEPLVGARISSWKPPKVGEHVDAGASLSDPARTFINPHHLYAATKNIDAVQNHLTGEIHDLYKEEGIRRRVVETVVKSMSNLTKIIDPGDHESYLRGQFAPLSVVKRINRDLAKEGRRPIEHEPTMKGVEMMPLSVQEDWMAKMQHNRLEQTLLEAAATGGVSHVHGAHPIPGMAFGAEFGLTQAHAKLPGYKHLEDVPAHHY